MYRERNLGAGIMMLGVVVGLAAFLFLAVTGGYWLYGHAVPHCACVARW